MKITCEACGSKYTIADDKVQGKRVKVRCKNCKASILVNGGGSGDAEEPAESEALDAGAPDQSSLAPKKPPAKKNAWSVNLTDDDSREMTTDEIVAGWKDGTVTSDAYVWKDGMTDWKPVLEVPELKAKLLAAKPKADAGVVSSTKRAPSASSSDDLFGASDIDVEMAGDLPRGPEGDKKAPTGARNESSVLFSLDSLRSADPPAPSPNKPKADDLFGGLGGGLGGGGLGGGSLGSNTDLLTAPAKDPPPAPVGARPAPAAVAVTVEPKKSKNGIIIAAIIAVGTLGGGYFAMNSGSGDDAAKIAAEAAAKAEKDAQDAKSAAQAELAKKEAELAKKEEELKKALAAGQKPPEPAPAAAAPTPEPTPAAGGAAKPAAAGSTAPKPAATAAAPAPAAPSGGGQFDAGAAKAALATAAANTASCAKPGGPTGSGKVEVTFAPSGRVTSANVVSGPFGGTPVGGCIATTFRKAKVPAFSGAPVTVSKSFRIN